MRNSDFGAARSGRGSVHQEAMQWGARFATSEPVSVLDLGGRDINGTPRALFPNAAPYVVLDIQAGPNVDIVGDAATWEPDREYDLVLCFECFEHTQLWPAICTTIFAALRPGGTAILTMAGPGRPAHSALDGGPLRRDEYYANVYPGDLEIVLKDAGFTDVIVDYQPGPADTRAVATKPSPAIGDTP
jgi:hypothetical protein